jgi:hypothetical protein
VNQPSPEPESWPAIVVQTTEDLYASYQAGAELERRDGAQRFFTGERLDRLDAAAMFRQCLGYGIDAVYAVHFLTRERYEKARSSTVTPDRVFASMSEDRTHHPASRSKSLVAIRCQLPVERLVQLEAVVVAESNAAVPGLPEFGGRQSSVSTVALGLAVRGLTERCTNDPNWFRRLRAERQRIIDRARIVSTYATHGFPELILQPDNNTN